MVKPGRDGIVEIITSIIRGLLRRKADAKLYPVIAKGGYDVSVISAGHLMIMQRKLHSARQEEKKTPGTSH